MKKILIVLACLFLSASVLAINVSSKNVKLLEGKDLKVFEKPSPKRPISTSNSSVGSAPGFTNFLGVAAFNKAKVLWNSIPVVKKTPGLVKKFDWLKRAHRILPFGVTVKFRNELQRIVDVEGCNYSALVSGDCLRE